MCARCTSHAATYAYDRATIHIRKTYENFQPMVFKLLFIHIYKLHAVHTHTTHIYYIILYYIILYYIILYYITYVYVCVKIPAQ